jgi:hypothetical protein
LRPSSKEGPTIRPPERLRVAGTQME